MSAVTRVWLAAAAAATGIALLAAALAGQAPDRLGEAGAVIVSATYAWALAARVGGRAVVHAAVALAVGVAAVTLDIPALRAGAAAVTGVLGAVLGVLLTVPARRFVVACREAALAIVVGAGGGLAALGYGAQVSVVRFDYATLAMALALVLAVVYRLGSGFHGLGVRGVGIMVGGGVMVVLTAGYAELLRRYGTPAIAETMRDIVAWSYDHLGAFPRPIQVLLGVPALVWGTHLRSRRPQGWWVCGFGVAATLPPVHMLVEPGFSLAQILVTEAYSFGLGIVVGYVLIRLARATTMLPADVARSEPRRTHVL